MRSVEEQWQGFVSAVERHGSDLFDAGAPIFGSRAPGRLDVLGGIADYSGSTVLEATIAEATFAAVQASHDPHVRVRSLAAVGEAARDDAMIPLDALFAQGSARPYDDVRGALRERPQTAWAAYAAGCLHVLAAEGCLDHARLSGASILVRSDVAIGAGVSSSAALEVSVMSALVALFGVELEGLELARLCQVVENRVVGAPCGIMDQVTCALGRADTLLKLKCQPHDVLGWQRVPLGWRFVGLDSGVKHAVGGRHYRRARVGAFMGLAVVQRFLERDLGGYICRLSATEWEAVREHVPQTIGGSAFLREYGTLPDTATSVDPEEVYNVRSCAEHPILENERVRDMLGLMSLAEADGTEDGRLLREAGRLLLGAHRSYSDRVDLGSSETDLLVDLVMERGAARGLYGAKITGGGSGGTVAVLAAGPDADAAIEEVRAEYARRTGIAPRLLTGSSPGACEFGARKVR